MEIGGHTYPGEVRLVGPECVLVLVGFKGEEGAALIGGKEGVRNTVESLDRLHVEHAF